MSTKENDKEYICIQKNSVVGRFLQRSQKAGNESIKKLEELIENYEADSLDLE